MIRLSEQQEQEMIAKARAGDPEANYRMSLWALEQAMAEPEEERWNRLAAKCLVKAAEAGYTPAQEKMEELLAQTAEPQPVRPAPERTNPAPVTPAQEPVRSAAAAPRRNPASEPPAAKPAAKSAAGVFAAVSGWIRNVFSGLTAKAKPATSDKSEAKTGLFDFNHWDDAKWKKMQIVCIIICAVLAVLIAAMVISGHGKDDDADTEIVIPPANVAATPVPATPSPTPAAYPDDDTKAEIAKAALTVFPDDADYVTEPTTRTVNTNGGPLNIRKGTGSDADWITSVSYGTKVDVYAFRNGWALIKTGSTWGWCSNDYLK